MTLFDIRFSKDSVFERICKAVQLAAMIGFASAGSRFTARVSPENVWAFRSLTMLLAGSRFMLALQYAINIIFMYGKMQSAIRGMWAIVAVLTGTGFSYLVVFASYLDLQGVADNCSCILRSVIPIHTCGQFGSDSSSSSR